MNENCSENGHYASIRSFRLAGLRIEADDLSSAIAGDPEFSVGVDAHSVGIAEVVQRRHFEVDRCPLVGWHKYTWCLPIEKSMKNKNTDKTTIATTNEFLSVFYFC